MFVHRSSSLEELIARLDENLKAPGLGLLEPETILIQSAGMERYLSRELARKSRIAANIRYPFPRAFLHDVLNRALSSTDAADAFERKNLSWALFVNLERHAQSDDPVFSPLKRALLDDADGLQRLILAEQLAHLFDQYLTYRPRMVLEWQTGAAPDEMQATLWRELVSQWGDQHFAARCHRFLNEISDEEIRAAVPARVSLLGGPGLPPLFLQMLRRIGRVVPTHVYAFAVCEEYFADSHPLSVLDLPVDETLHPLLVSLGRVGADFQRCLESVGEYEEGEASFVYPQVDSLLTALQQSLIRGSLPQDERATQEFTAFDPSTDRSITLDSCHSRLREVEVLHDRILGWFHRDPTLRPEDIVVLAPDIEQYSALISAVFDARAGARPRIPFRVADRSERSTNVAARSLLLALRLLRGRFRASEVLDLFQEGPVQARYGVEASDLEKVSAWVQGSGIRWGVDGAHRAELDLPPYSENTWRFGLRRLFLGYALFDEGEQIFSGTVPFDAMPASDLPLLGKFAEFCEALFSLRGRLSQAPASGLTSEQWAVFMDDLVRALLPDGSDGEWELSPLIASLAELAERPRLLSERTGLEGEIRWGLSAMLHLLEEELISMRPSTEFLSGGVTFCTLLPLRTIPFRALCVLGLNQGEFPRSDRPHPFDLMARDPKHGDRSLRADDNYLFMEVLLAAREKLALSYVGRSVQDNAVEPPSTVVTQLREALTLLCSPFTCNGPRQDLKLLPTTQHPLQPFSAAYFEQESGGLESFDEEAYVAALSLSQEQKPVDAFFLNAEKEGIQPAPQALGEEGVELTLADLISFWKDPARAYLLTRGVRIDDEPRQLEDREPVEPSFLTNYQVGERLLARLAQVGNIRTEVELGRGDLPIGRGGEALLASLKGAAESIDGNAERFRGAPRPPVDLTLRVAPLAPGTNDGMPMYAGALVITGTLQHLYGDHGLEVSYGKVTPKRILSLWIHHLAACAQGTELAASVLVARGSAEQSNGVEVFGLAKMTKTQAMNELSTLGRIALHGRCVPLPFFPVASHLYVDALQKPSKKLSEQEQIRAALRKARASLIDKNKPGEMDAHLVQLYRGVVPLSVDECDPGVQLFCAMSELVYRPLLAQAQAFDDSAAAVEPGK